MIITLRLPFSLQRYAHDKQEIMLDLEHKNTFCTALASQYPSLGNVILNQQGQVSGFIQLYHESNAITPEQLPECEAIQLDVLTALSGG